MSLGPVIHLAAPTLHTLGLDDVPGLQLTTDADLAGHYHPPLNPDTAALILAVEDWPRLKALLLYQYAPDHPAAVVTHPSLAVQHLALAALDERLPTGPDVVLYIAPLAQAGSFERFQDTIAHLRAPDGCPWDRKQTHASLRPYLLEETYEVLDALDSGDVDDLREELGDLLLQIVLHGQIAVDSGEFRLADVIAAINAKIIRRHPHVWGTVEVNDERDVTTNWDKLKQAEKNGQRKSRLEGVSRSLPALSQALSYQERAARVRFEWESIEPVIGKVREELGELLAAENDEERGKELGDLLFAVVNLARWMHVDPESALRGTNGRFFRRFHYIEEQAAAQGRDLDTMTLDEMDALWNAAKALGL